MVATNNKVGGDFFFHEANVMEFKNNDIKIESDKQIKIYAVNGDISRCIREADES